MGVFFRCPTSESVRLESRALLGLIAGARGVERVIYRRMVRLICAGWLPQGEVFGWSGAAALTVGRRTRVCFVLLKAEKRVTPHARRRLLRPDDQRSSGVTRP
jgi:hypothetical protein